VGFHSDRMKYHSKFRMWRFHAALYHSFHTFISNLLPTPHQQQHLTIHETSRLYGICHVCQWILAFSHLSPVCTFISSFSKINFDTLLPLMHSYPLHYFLLWVSSENLVSHLLCVYLPWIIHPLFFIIYSVNRHAKSCPSAWHEGTCGNSGTASCINCSATRWAINVMPKLV
jgi:hypothetical protein